MFETDPRFRALLGLQPAPPTDNFSEELISVDEPEQTEPTVTAPVPTPATQPAPELELPQFSASDLPLQTKRKGRDKAVAAMGQNIDAQTQSVERESEFKAREDEVTRAGLERQAKMQEDFANIFTETSEKIKAANFERVNKIRADIEGITAMDPNRWWNDKSSLQRAALMFSGAVGGLNAAFGDGSNKAVEAIQREIDRDINIQQSDRDAKFRKAGMGLQIAGTLNESALQELNHKSIAQAARLESVIAAVKAEALKYSSPQLQEQMLRTAAQLEGQKNKLYAEYFDGLVNEHTNELKTAFDQRLRSAQLAEQKRQHDDRILLERDKMFMGTLEIGSQEHRAQLEAEAKARQSAHDNAVRSSFRPGKVYGQVSPERAKQDKFWERKAALDDAAELAKQIHDHMKINGRIYAGMGRNFFINSPKTKDLRRMIGNYYKVKLKAQGEDKYSDSDIKLMEDYFPENGWTARGGVTAVWAGEVKDLAREGSQLFQRTGVGADPNLSQQENAARLKAASDEYYRELDFIGEVQETGSTGDVRGAIRGGIKLMADMTKNQELLGAENIDTHTRVEQAISSINRASEELSSGNATLGFDPTLVLDSDGALREIKKYGTQKQVDRAVEAVKQLKARVNQLNKKQSRREEIESTIEILDAKGKPVPLFPGVR